jgi:hypothetical protein
MISLPKGRMTTSSYHSLPSYILSTQIQSDKEKLKILVIRINSTTKTKQV